MRLSNQQRLDRLRSLAIRNFGFNSVTKNTIFTDKETPVELFCDKHSMIFYNNMKRIYQKMGCDVCYQERQRLKSLKTTSKFIEDSLLKHGKKYDYSKVNYTDCRIPVEIICKIHGSFHQKPKYHMEGKGCKECGSLSKSVKDNSFGSRKFKSLAGKMNNQGTLYIIKCFGVDDEVFFKVGITARNTKERFHGKRNMPYRYEIVKEIKSDPDTIWNLEKKMHKTLKSKHYRPKIKFFGYFNECFSDVSEVLNYEQ